MSSHDLHRPRGIFGGPAPRAAGRPHRSLARRGAAPGHPAHAHLPAAGLGPGGRRSCWSSTACRWPRRCWRSCATRRACCGDVFRRAPTRENLKQYEEDLENASYAKELRAAAHAGSCSPRSGRVGNKKAVVGPRRLAVLHAGGAVRGRARASSTADLQQTRIKAALDAGDEAIHPDPRPAMLELRPGAGPPGHPAGAVPGARQGHASSRSSCTAAGPAARAALPVAGNRDFPRFVAELRASGRAGVRSHAGRS